MLSRKIRPFFWKCLLIWRKVHSHHLKTFKRQIKGYGLWTQQYSTDSSLEGMWKTVVMNWKWIVCGWGFEVDWSDVTVSKQWMCDKCNETHGSKSIKIKYLILVEDALHVSSVFRRSSYHALTVHLPKISYFISSCSTICSILEKSMWTDCTKVVYFQWRRNSLQKTTWDTVEKFDRRRLAILCLQRNEVELLQGPIMWLVQKIMSLLKSGPVVVWFWEYSRFVINDSCFFDCTEINLQFACRNESSLFNERPKMFKSAKFAFIAYLEIFWTQKHFARLASNESKVGRWEKDSHKCVFIKRNAERILGQFCTREMN